MTTKNRKSTVRDEHIGAVEELLALLKTQLTKSAGEKGTYADYLRLLEFYNHANPVQPRKLIVGWVNNMDECDRYGEAIQDAALEEALQEQPQ